MAQEIHSERRESHSTEIFIVFGRRKFNFFERDTLLLAEKYCYFLAEDWNEKFLNFSL